LSGLSYIHELHCLGLGFRLYSRAAVINDPGSDAMAKLMVLDAGFRLQVLVCGFMLTTWRPQPKR
jgi:hypothetical protein